MADKLIKSGGQEAGENKFTLTSPYFVNHATAECQGSSKRKAVAGKETSPRKRSPSKFGGMSDEEVMQLKLPDRIGFNLDILFIGINPGLMSAYRGHHYSGANNHFWPCLYESGLVAERLGFMDDEKCPSLGIGLTNIVERTTRGSSDLSRKEIKDGIKEMIDKIKKYKPRIACFNGKGIYEIFSGGKCTIGRQPMRIAETETVVYVMPSTSGRTMTYPRARDKLPFFIELKDIRDSLMAAKTVKNENELTNAS